MSKPKIVICSGITRFKLYKLCKFNLNEIMVMKSMQCKIKFNLLKYFRNVNQISMEI